MKSNARALAIAVSLAATCALWAQEPRYLDWMPGERIADRLLPEDHYVVIQKHFPSLGSRVPGDLSPKEILEGSTLHAEAVLVVKLTESKPALTKERDWIVTRLRGRIVEQLKPHGLTLRISDFALELEGGTLKIGPATVAASAHWTPRLQTGRTYLIFSDTRRWPSSEFIAYEIGSDGHLHNTDPRFDPQDDIDNLDGVLWTEARKMILSAPPRGRVTGLN